MVDREGQVMTRRLATMAAAAVLVCAALTASTAFAADVVIPPNKPGSAELVNKMNVPGDVTKGLFWNGRTVTFRGEAIGEVMVRGDYAWIHLNDDAYMIKNVEEGAKLGGYNSGMAVWVPAALTKAIDTYGDYQHEGSIVEVSGVFNGACKEHGGDVDIHATSLRLLVPGHDVADPVPAWKAILAVLIAGTAGLLFWVERKYRHIVRAHRGV
jgi:opacity protein-like surface antigen